MELILGYASHINDFQTNTSERERESERARARKWGCVIPREVDVVLCWCEKEASSEGRSLHLMWIC